MRTLRIGVVGYHGQEFDEYVANELLATALEAVFANYPDANDIWIVSGLTDLGIPALAYRAAKVRSWKTSGIACAKAEEHDCFDVDERKIVGSNWGDESEIFLGEIDVIVRVGGGEQAFAEARAARKMGKRTYEYELAAS